MPNAAAKKSTDLKLWRGAVRRKLLAWFAGAKRDLPWRRTRDPYAIWVSEIMLQQTQVATVIGYFERFLTAFPTVESLANAEEDQVFRLWEGLGYYRRARQMHKAARVIVEEHGGQFPGDFEKVLALPGVGRYTAGAILSIAHDQPLPILEANTIRLLSRLIGLREDVSAPESQRTLWKTAESLAKCAQPGAVNQALMELGALVCSPREPRCLVCPLAGLCAARRLNLVEQIPRLRAKAATEAVREAAIVIERRGSVLLRKISEGERWAGLWDFVRFLLPADNASEREIIIEAERRAGVGLKSLSQFATLKHGVTRFRITLDCYRGEAAGSLRNQSRSIGSPAWRWARVTELEGLPLSSTGRKIARLIAAERSTGGRKRSRTPARQA